MDIPWDVIASSAGFSAVVTVMLVYAGKKAIDLSQARLASTLARADETWTRRAEFGIGVDVGLRQTREAVYAELWQLTGDLPKWPRKKSVTHAGLFELSKKLQNWYFQKGGIYLSSGARTRYGAVQQGIAQVLSAAAGKSLVKDEKHKEYDYTRDVIQAVERFLEEKPESMLTDDEYSLVMRACSTLRTQLTNDLLSRREAPALVE